MSAPRGTLDLDTAPAGTRHALVIAGTHSEYIAWFLADPTIAERCCVRYLIDPAMLFGLNPRDTTLVLAGTWFRHPQAREILRRVRLLEDAGARVQRQEAS